MSDDTKGQRVVEARMKLRARFLEKMRELSAADRPLGSGPPNRHGMPQLPPGQTRSEKWPVLDLGRQPVIPLDQWRLQVFGLVEEEVVLTWEDFKALSQTRDTSDFHCVTGWSKLDIFWEGVRVADVLALARPLPEARFLMAHAYDGYTTNVPLWEALKEDVLLVHTAFGAPLPREHGGPVRMITPQLWAWKGAKWIARIEVLANDKRGFWEERGYSNTAHPWRNDRYA